MLRVIKIASSVTEFDVENKNRTINLDLASQTIDSKVIKPGEIFSFNKVLGPRTIERGYKLAESIDNKKIVKTVGGGICQVSSTLYMSVKKLNLQVLEVHKHSIPVKYAKREDEAAVSWNELDFRFKNTLPYSIKIVSKIDKINSLVIVEIEKLEIPL